MSELLNKLKQFDQKDEHKRLQLGDEFKEIAYEIIFGGYFKVCYHQQTIREIHIKDVEGYFFDETSPEADNCYHDWIMYHRTHYTWDKKGVKKVIKPDYLPIGSFYLHTSGIDLTFERHDLYRASFLLRSYVIIEKGNVIERNGKPVETRPTYLYDDMFQGISPFCEDYKVEWLPNKKDGNLALAYRQNVGLFTEYNDDGPHEPEKITKSSSSYIKCLEDNHGLSTQDGKGIQDTNLWRFYDAEYEKYLKLKKSVNGISL